RVEIEQILGHEVALTPESRLGVRYFGHLAHDPWHASNNDEAGSGPDRYYIYHKIADERNHLVLVTSDIGGAPLRSPTISQWPLEEDLYWQGKTFYAIGRHLLFEVIRPTEKTRLRISLSRSLMGGGDRTLLPAKVL